jgi:hypothetical protein
MRGGKGKSTCASLKRGEERMSVLSSVSRGKIKRPISLIVYGQGGVGKTTLPSKAPSPLYIGPEVEAGTAWLDVSRAPAPKSLSDLKTVLGELLKEPHDFKTLVLDSLDTTEPLVFEAVCREAKVQSIEDAFGGYGKGYVRALALWRELIGLIQELQAKKGMHFVGIAHAQVKSHTDPKTNHTWNRYSMKLNEKASQLWKESVDALLYATHEFFSQEQKGGRAKAFSTGKRVLLTSWTTAHDAKNRMNLPEEIALDWDSLLEAWNAAQVASPAEIIAQITEKLEGAKEELKTKVMASVETARGDAGELARIYNKLCTVL